MAQNDKFEKGGEEGERREHDYRDSSPMAQNDKF